MLLHRHVKGGFPHTSAAEHVLGTFKCSLHLHANYALLYMLL